MVNNVSLDALAIAAHPDDVEITCGGLLIKLVKMGRKVGVLDLTQGEMGTHGDENARASEAAAAANIMGLSYRDNLKLPDSGLMHNQENRLKIADAIRQTKPELVILPHWEQRHPDHLAACKLGYDACFLAGLKKLPIPDEPHRPRKIIYASYYRNIDYSFLVDISDEFDQKNKAVMAYVSQFGNNSSKANNEQANDSEKKNIFEPGVDIVELMHTRAKVLGQKGNCQYAEAYTVKETMVVNDPQKMLVSSV